MIPATLKQRFADRLGRRAAVLEWFAVLLVFALAGAGPVPDENETVYLAKAKHFWNPQWCAGDLFLQSADTHWLFYASFGWMTRVADLETVALVGRAITWSLQAAAWLFLVRCITPKNGLPFYAALGLAVAAGRGRFSGEWLFGGFEAKGLAYAAAWTAWAAVLKKRPELATVAFGLAIGLHPLVGGWMALAALVALLVVDWRTRSSAMPTPTPARPPAAAFAFGAVLAAVGVVPAVAQDLGAAPGILNQARRIYVFDRLPHHLYPPQILAGYGWFQPALVLLALAALVAMRRERTARLLAAALVASLGLAAGGWAASVLLPPAQSAVVLRFYLFRPLDAFVPLGLVLGAAIGWREIAGRMSTHRAAIVTCAVIGLLAAQLAYQAHHRVTSGWVDPVVAPRCRADWVRVCRFIREETSRDAVFITPVFAQSFKWYADRAEVANWKDCPQDGPHIVQWWERIASLYGRVSPGGGRYWFGDTDELAPERLEELASRWGATHVLAERGEALLPFPIAWEGDCYRLYRVRWFEQPLEDRLSPKTKKRGEQVQ